ncbi:MAG: hypothetical protein HYX94_10695 [Chloroflexi bacterium]|nr:hypothetical protein [Chloroflexota bacterium]
MISVLLQSGEPKEFSTTNGKGGGVGVGAAGGALDLGVEVGGGGGPPGGEPGLGVPVEVGSGVQVGPGTAVREVATTGVSNGEIGPVVPVRVMTAVAVTNGMMGPGPVAGLVGLAGARVGVDNGEATVGVALLGKGVIGREGRCMPQPIINMATSVTPHRKKRLTHSLRTGHIHRSIA